MKHLDVKQIEEIIPLLNGMDLPVWFDKYSIALGDSITDKVQEGIQQSSIVLFWITEHFLDSRWCKFEMRAFIKKLIESPKDGLKSLITLAVFVVLFVVAWLLGSSEKVSIIGYEGTDNVGFWAQFTDMIIYATYALFIAIIGTIAGAGIYTKLK